MVDRVTWFPQKIDYGLVKDSVTLQKPEDITIWLPPGVLLGDVTLSSSNVFVTALDGQENTGGSVYQLEVSLRAVRNGPFSERISITTTDTNHPLIEIPLVGEVIGQ